MTRPTSLLETVRLRLVPQSPDDVRAQIDAMNQDQRAQLSADWLDRLRAATTVDPWTLGFAIVDRATAIGTCGFKGPPDADGTVEIAYGIEPEQQNRGYATEAARALVEFACVSGRVRLVRAHTLAVANASARVLVKCGFRSVGEVTDRDDGQVWRWELACAAGVRPGAGA